jgi:hypothetical protein
MPIKHFFSKSKKKKKLFKCFWEREHNGAMVLPSHTWKLESLIVQEYMQQDEDVVDEGRGKRGTSGRVKRGNEG